MLIDRIKNLQVWKKRSFWISVIFFLLGTAFFLIRIIISGQTLRYEGSFSFEQGNQAERVAIYSGISLNPGVYRIELEYETDTELQALCNVRDETVCTGGLLSNGEHFYKGLGKTGYDIWLYEKTDDLQVVITFSGKGSLTTGNLKIVETNKLWTMLLTVFLFIGAVFYIIWFFFYYNRQYPVLKEKKQVFFFVMTIGFIASIPYLCEYSITGADLTYHLQRIEGVKDGLLGGQFPVRLEPKWVFGHGYANAIFYCNSFLYFPALLRMLGFTVSASYNAYCIVISFATAWISYYCFSRIFKRNIGIICSALYTLSIFRIYKLIITSATGEGTAFTFIPLVFYGLYRILAEDPEEKKYKTAWIPLMLGMSGLIQSHVLTCEITVGVIFLFCMIYVKKIFRKSTFMELFKAVAASVLINLWFLVPFLDYYLTQDVHIKHVAARTIQESGLYFAQLLFHFWTIGSHTPSDGQGMYHSHPVGVGLVLAAALGVFLILWFSGAFREHTRKNFFAKATAVVGVLLLFMSMNIFPWDKIQSINPVFETLVSSLQFPNRFLGWGTACLAFIFGYCLKYFAGCDKRFYWGMAAAALVGVTTSGMYLLDSLNGGQNYFELYNEEGMGFGYISGEEYLIEGTKLEQLTFAVPVAGRGMEIVDYRKKYLHVEIECENREDTENFVDLPLLLYKGYRATAMETGQRLEICAGENNVIRVLIPAGFEGGIEVDFVSPVYWRVSELISLVAVLSLIICLVAHRRRVEC